LRHRPIGLGVQGLADAFIMLRLPFTGDEAKAESRNFETLYFAACNCIYGIGKIEGPYSTFEGSPISQGEFQHNLWN
jgi:ribonucleoside-diphosphate reductase alpha chain